MIVKITNESFEDAINEQVTPYFLKFGSKTCGPCNTMKPVLESLAKNNPNHKVFDIDTDESPELASKFEIRAVPTIHLCEGREILYSFHGLTPLRDLEYSLHNINDAYFREHGEFKIKEELAVSKNDYKFNFLIFVVISIFIATYFLF